MKHIKYFMLAAAFVTLTSAGTAIQNTYTLAQGYVVGIHGTSNLHDWDEKVTTVTGDGAVQWNSDGTYDLSALNIKMEVHSIKSTEGSIMNNNTYKALKADEHPQITFALTTPVKSIPVTAGGHVISTKVDISIAGVTKAVDMSVIATAQEHGAITFDGSKTIKMTDFGIKPPVALFGTLKTGDDITIHFRGVFVSNK